MDLDKTIEVVFADATTYLQQMDENKEQFDVVFIDAAKGQYLVFLENAIRLVKSGGTIIADNVLFKGRVMSDYNDHKHRTAVTRLRKYIDTINNDERLTSKIIDVGDGLAISIVKK
ncbi:putative O-methyltransferase [compost metagenome]